MAKKKPSAKSSFEMFDVLYEDGSQTSNRRMPASEIPQFDADVSIRAFFEAEDQVIEERSGRKRAAIKTIERCDSR